MKNIIILLLCVLFVSAQAQEATTQDVNTSAPLVSKKGTPILPAAGDIAIGVDALPFFKYFGQMFNNASNNSLDISNTNLYFKYYLSDNTAVRAILSIGANESIDRNYVRDDAAIFQNPLSDAKIVDKRKTIMNNYAINIGFQKSRGYGRMRGLYGAQVNYSYGREIYKYEYGNSMTLANPNPTTSFGASSPRLLEDDRGITQSIGIGGLAGIEYYFMPKVCVGFEVGLNYLLKWKSQGNTRTEEVSNGIIIEKDNVNSPEGRTNQGLNSSTSNNTLIRGNAGLYLLFHF